MKRRPTPKNTWADHYTEKARKENYPARSVFKLREIQQKTNILQKGYRVLDLGCAPGSWLLQAAEYVGPKGFVLGIDLVGLEIALPDHAQARTGDIFDVAPELAETEAPFNVVMSDMAPFTTGQKHVDAARSMALSEMALWVSESLLLPGGSFVCKIFQQGDFQQFIQKAKQQFTTVKIVKPDSTRKASKEVFVIGIQKKGDVHGGT